MFECILERKRIPDKLKEIILSRAHLPYYIYKYKYIMKIISLSSSIAGPACSVACSIKKHYYNNNYKTNIFDYLEISLIGVIQVCLLDDEQIEYLSNNNIITSNKDGNKSVQFANFDKMISHHDLPENYSDEDYKNFIDKYIRRFRRFMNDIMTEDSIYFIRYGYELEDDIKLFINLEGLC